MRKIKKKMKKKNKGFFLMKKFLFKLKKFKEFLYKNA